MCIRDRALNDQISYVAQEQFLFNMSLLENIRLGRPEATDQEVLAAAEKGRGKTNDIELGINTEQRRIAENHCSPALPDQAIYSDHLPAWARWATKSR